VFTQEDSGVITYKKNRPILLLTSTSYTPDEDIGLLVDALAKYATEA